MVARSWSKKVSQTQEYFPPQLVVIIHTPNSERHGYVLIGAQNPTVATVGEYRENARTCRAVVFDYEKPWPLTSLRGFEERDQHVVLEALHIHLEDRDAVDLMLRENARKSTHPQMTDLAFSVGQVNPNSALPYAFVIEGEGCLAVPFTNYGFDNGYLPNIVRRQVEFQAVQSDGVRFDRQHLYIVQNRSLQREGADIGADIDEYTSIRESPPENSELTAVPTKL